MQRRWVLNVPVDGGGNDAQALVLLDQAPRQSLAQERTTLAEELCRITRGQPVPEGRLQLQEKL
jgi:hypothetical protein